MTKEEQEPFTIGKPYKTKDGRTATYLGVNPYRIHTGIYRFTVEGYNQVFNYHADGRLDNNRFSVLSHLDIDLEE